MKKLLIGILAAIIIGTITVLALNFTKTDPVVIDEKSNVRIELADGVSNYPMDAKVIAYTIVNETEQSVDIVLIPKLEWNLGLQFEDKWEQVEFLGEVGFCGTGDIVEGKEAREGTIEMAWFKNLDAGKYRLTFESSDGTIVKPAEFVLHGKKSAS